MKLNKSKKTLSLVHEIPYLKTFTKNEFGSVFLYMHKGLSLIGYHINNHDDAV